jgi:hypothetical protein
MECIATCKLSFPEVMFGLEGIDITVLLMYQLIFTLSFQI